ncbi:MAG: hypothetical protein SVM80_00925 [Halobacteriota archaeon]|nr:hypothetical protein [Halobacteriota archaeon]
MSDKAEELYMTVSDLSKSQWTRKNALDELIGLGETDTLNNIINEKEKSDWVRKQALEGLVEIGAERELKGIVDNPNMAGWIRKTAEKNLSKMVKKPKEYVDVTISVDLETKEMMGDIASRSNRTIPDVLQNFIEEGKITQSLRDEIKDRENEIKSLKQEMTEIQDLKEMNSRLRREKVNLQETVRKLRINSSNASKRSELFEKALEYYKVYAGTLKDIINELDCEFVDHVSCPSCGAEVTLITGYEISDNKIKATDGYCTDCLSK